MSNQTSDNNKRISKNTIALYIRTLITLAVGLFTSRVVLNVLGVDNFGIYNVVGGVVGMFNIVTTSLSQSISRYLTFELGRNNKERLRVIFCTSVNIQILMSLVIVILAEAIGVWFLNNKMNIPLERLYAANWVFQFSILAFIVNLISVPYNAALIAHEKMKAFAYVSILEALMKLIIAYLLYVSFMDKLITYAFLLLMVSVIIRIVYGQYCKRNFEECKYSFIFNKKLFSDMSKFAGWNFLASTAYIFNTQGVNIISNMFFGVAINAARGIATQVDGITRNFVCNFTTAIRPQIVKSYSVGNTKYMNRLVCSGAKYSYFLMLFFALPFMFEAETILQVWLKLVPDHSPTFIRLTMIVSLVWLLGDTMYTSIMAIGKLKKYMIYETCITCLVFPVSYFAFYVNMSPDSAYIIYAFAYMLLLLLRLWYLKRVEHFPIGFFLKAVIYPVVLSSLVACIAPLTYKCFFYDGSIVSFIISICVCVCSFIISVFFFGLSYEERVLIISKIRK